MSAIVLPFIHSTTTIGDPEPLNIEQVQSYNKVDVPAINNDNAKYHIVFNAGAEGVRSITWSYTTSVLRDADFDAIIVATSTEIP